MVEAPKPGVGSAQRAEVGHPAVAPPEHPQLAAGRDRGADDRAGAVDLRCRRVAAAEVAEVDGRPPRSPHEGAVGARRRRVGVPDHLSVTAERQAAEPRPVEHERARDLAAAGQHTGPGAAADAVGRPVDQHPPVVVDVRCDRVARPVGDPRRHAVAPHEAVHRLGPRRVEREADHVPVVGDRGGVRRHTGSHPRRQGHRLAPVPPPGAEDPGLGIVERHVATLAQIDDPPAAVGAPEVDHRHRRASRSPHRAGAHRRRRHGRPGQPQTRHPDGERPGHPSSGLPTPPSSSTSTHHPRPARGHGPPSPQRPRYPRGTKRPRSRTDRSRVAAAPKGCRWAALEVSPRSWPGGGWWG
jgi:hypothetical protein